MPWLRVRTFARSDGLFDRRPCQRRLARGRRQGACRMSRFHQRRAHDVALLHGRSGTPFAGEPAMSSIVAVEVVVMRHIRGAPERLFDAWIDPASIAQWFGPGLGE